MDTKDNNSSNDITIQHDNINILSINKYKRPLSHTDLDNSEYISKHSKTQQQQQDNSFNLSSLSQESDNSSDFHSLIDQQINQNQLQIQQQSPPLLLQQIPSSPPSLDSIPFSSTLLTKSDFLSIDFPIQQQQQQIQLKEEEEEEKSYFDKFKEDIKNMIIIESVNDVDKSLFDNQLKDTTYTPIFESKYTNRPPFFKKKTSIRDKLPCQDNKSFLYCIAYHFSQKFTYLQDYKKNTLDKYINRINDQDLSYPVNPIDENQLIRFEKNVNIGINIFYMIQHNKIGILRKTSFKDHSHKTDVVNMLFHKSSDRTVKYLYIASLPTILGFVYNKNMKNKHVCSLCLQILDTAKKLELHNQLNTSL